MKTAGNTPAVNALQTPDFAGMIRLARKAQDMNQEQLAARVGVTRNTVAGWETGHSRPDLATVPALCRALRISLNRFFGLRESRSEKEREVLELLFSLEEEDRQVLLWQAEAIRDRRMQQLREATLGRFRKIWVSDLGVAAGFGATLDEAAGTEMFILAEGAGQADEVITVSGRSMEPTFYEGDQVLVRHCKELREGEIGIFLTEGEGFIKEYRKDGLHSHNPQYATMKFTDLNDVQLVGKVIGTVTGDMLPDDKQLKILEETDTAGKRGSK